MGQIIRTNYGSDEGANISRIKYNLAEATKDILSDARIECSQENSIGVPISQLATLGAGVSSLVPAFRTVTQTMTVNTSGLYQLANASVGDTLKAATNGNFWGI